MQARAKRNPPTGSWRRKEAVYGYLLASPWILGFIIFTLGTLDLFPVYRISQITDCQILRGSAWRTIQAYLGTIRCSERLSTIPFTTRSLQFPWGSSLPCPSPYY